ncbi:MAG: radical SAM protein [Burkholderiales bacterium]|nr:radical SAM protein [Burkholderiales bacterium]
MMPAAAPTSLPQPPYIVSWNLTRRCNLVCAHCYLDAVQRKTQAGDELDTEDALTVIGQLSQMAPGAMLVLTGGEPLLRSDLPRLVKAAADGDLMPVVGTNGTLLDAARARVLKDAGAAGVGISLDSSAPEFHDRLRGAPGAWAGARRGIAVAREAGLAIVVQATVFEDNRGDLGALAELAAQAGAMAFNVFFLVCTGRGVTQTDLASASYEETLREIVRLQGRHPGLKIRARCAPYMRRLQGLHAGESGGGYADWSSACLAGRRYFRITPQGQVTPCPYVPAAIGDLRTQSLQQIWTGHPTLHALRNELPGGKCGTCDFRYSCGGCRARALAQHGDLLAEDPKCAYVPPPGRAPETPAESGQRRRVEWEPDADARLLHIPAFVRGTVKAMLEERAAGEGIDRITVEFVSRHRPPAAVLDRLRFRVRTHEPID